MGQEDRPDHDGDRGARSRSRERGETIAEYEARREDEGHEDRRDGPRRRSSECEADQEEDENAGDERARRTALAPRGKAHAIRAAHISRVQLSFGPWTRLASWKR